MKRALIFVVTLFVSATVVAEKRLEKNGGEYLGTQTAKDSFLTCAGGKLSIGNGKIRTTDDRCSSSIVGPVSGSLHKAGSLLVLNDSHGNEIVFELTKDELAKLNELSSGDTVKITYEHGKRRIAKN